MSSCHLVVPTFKNNFVFLLYKQEPAVLNGQPNFMVQPTFPVHHYLKTTATIEWTWSVLHDTVSRQQKTLQQAAIDFTAGWFFLLRWSLLNLLWRLWTWHMYKADLPDVISVHGREQRGKHNHPSVILLEKICAYLLPAKGFRRGSSFSLHVLMAIEKMKSIFTSWWLFNRRLALRFSDVYALNTLQRLLFVH